MESKYHMANDTNHTTEEYGQIQQERVLISSSIQADANQNDNLLPEELSGDQNGEAFNPDTKKANRLFTVASIVKTVIGSGILTIPYTLDHLGYLFGTLLFFGAISLNQFGSVLLLKAKNLSKHSNYSTILYEIWPSLISKGIGSAIIFLACMGVCIADLIFFKTALRKLLVDILNTPEQADILDDFYTTPVFIVLVVAIFETPLTLASKIQKLKFMSLTGLIGITIFMLTFILYFFICLISDDFGDKPKGGMVPFPSDWFKAAAAVPNIFFAITFQNNFFPLFKGLKGPSDKKMAQVSFMGVGFCAVSYILVGLIGYHYFGPGVSANFLSSFHYATFSKPFFFLLNTSFLVSIFFAFPIMFFGCRNNFIALIQLFIERKNRRLRREQGELQLIESLLESEEPDLQHRKKKAKLYFVLYTIVIYLLIVGTAMGVDDIQIVFNAIGAICGASLCPLLPCAFYVKLILMRSKPKTPIFYLSIVIFCVMTPYALFSIVSLYI